MCHQTTYTLPCEHIRTHIVYCADAAIIQSSTKSSNKSSSKGSGSGSNSGTTTSAGNKSKATNSTSSKRSPSSHGSNTPPKRQPCRNLTTQSTPYPVPPSFQGDPSMAASSPLLPKCELSPCPFEEKNRLWNCCWCGKEWNEQGRCSCIMIIDGSQVRCEHICCPTCEAAGGGFSRALFP